LIGTRFCMGQCDVPNLKSHDVTPVRECPTIGSKGKVTQVASEALGSINRANVFREQY
jgi:hypothetical protein